MPALLEGVRVLDITDDIGAYATRLLADLGADVLRVVPSTGDPLNAVPPHDIDTGASFFEIFMNLNKRIGVLNLQSLEGEEELINAASSADVVVTSLHGYGDNWSLKALARQKRLRPQVHVRIFPYAGQLYPRSDWVMEDILCQAAGGLLTLSGSPEREPLCLFGNQTAFIVGVHAAGAAMIALFDALRRGESVEVEVSGVAAVIHTLESAIQDYTTEGRVRTRKGSSGQAGDGAYHCADGFVVLACIADSEWARLLDWLESAGQSIDPHMRHWDLTWRRQPDAVAQFRELFETFARRHSRERLYVLGQAAEVQISPVNNLRDLFSDPQLTFERWFTEVTVPHFGSIAAPGPPYRISGAPTVQRSNVSHDAASGLLVWLGAMSSQK